ncbi:MAG: ATP-binding protein [Clostridia bacterium]|nr:ATP-binding protein [Clostridia bacterium]
MEKINIGELKDSDFEDFSKDILSYKLGTKMRTFRKCKDKGIDAISLEEEKNWIMQAKFYKNTSDSTMMRQLKLESQKVKKLKPDRYFLFICKILTEKQFEEITDIFSPYLKKEDIYDEVIIKDILDEKEAEFILEKWDKLWLPSSYALQKLYEKFKRVKYDYKKGQIVKESKLFVETEVYKKAIKTLEEKNVILIHGQPGAGKTMLARRLAMKYIYKGYKFYFENAINIKEIENYIYTDEKMVIIIDDFLGESTLELKGISDNKIYDIISYAKRNDNIKLILTTRTYIYNSAKQVLEKLAHASERLEKLLIEVNDYTQMDKAKILYNHLYYNNLLWSIEYLEIIRDQYYKIIINHTNFTPRNIERICEIIQEEKQNSVIEVISNLLDNPEEIWKHEYAKLENSRYGKYGKTLLDLVCFLKYEVEEEALKEQFEKIVLDKSEYEEYMFYEAIEELSYAFISISFNMEGRKTYKLANPSMGDFLRLKARQSKNTIKEYIKKMNSVEGIYDLLQIFLDDIEMQGLIKQRVEEIIEQNKNLDYFDKRLISYILDGDITKKTKSLN